jgi:hypothetical protein
MADKRITALTELTYANMAATDVLAIEDITAGNTMKAELQDLKQYFLENKTIGGSNDGDIVTIDGTQTFTNKTLTLPKLNEAVAVTATATEVNKLDGVTAVTADFNAIAGIAAAGITPTEIGYLNGVTQAIQTQINAISTAQGTDMLYKAYCYSEGWTEGTNTQAWTATAMMTALGIDTDAYVIDPTSLQVQTSILSGGTYTLQLDPTISWTTATASGQTYLDTLTIANLTATTHAMSCNFKIMAKAGV